MELDSMQSMLQQASEILVVDDAMIARRKDSINMKIDFIKTHLKTKASEQLESDMNILSGIASNYGRFLKEYPSEVYDNDELTKNTTQLRKDFVEGKIDKNAFEIKYRISNSLIVQHLKNAKKTVDEILPIDNEYHRCSKSVNEAYKQLAVGN